MKRTTMPALLTIFLGLVSPGVILAQESGLKIYISVDMEGLVGAVTSDQLGPSGFEYQRFRQIMTNEVNAAIGAAREMGATEILISDSHGNGENLLIEQLPSDIQSLKLSTQEITLRPGEAVRIDVEMTRAEGFDKNISLDVLFKHLSSVWGDTLPKGVKLDGSKSKILITGKETKGHITLVADDKIEKVQRQQVSVMANISLNFVMKATYSSLPLFITTVPNEVEPEK